MAFFYEIFLLTCIGVYVSLCPVPQVQSSQVILDAYCHCKSFLMICTIFMCAVPCACPALFPHCLSINVKSKYQLSLSIKVKICQAVVYTARVGCTHLCMN